MNPSAVEIAMSAVETVTVTEDTLTVGLSDGRSLSVLLAWFTRLVHATLAERRSWRSQSGEGRVSTGVSSTRTFA